MAGKVDTDFIPRHYDELFPKRDVSHHQVCQAVLALMLSEKQGSASNSRNDPFSVEVGARLNHHLLRTFSLSLNGEDFSSVTAIYLEKTNTFKLVVDGIEYHVNGQLVVHEKANFTELTCEIDGNISKERVLVDNNEVKVIAVDTCWFTFIIFHQNCFRLTLAAVHQERQRHFRAEATQVPVSAERVWNAR